jgi:Uma2 family endonuclease
MAIAESQKLTFEQFLEQYPDDRGQYESIDGEIVEMRAMRWHDDIADFLTRKFAREVERSHLNYRVTGRLVLALLVIRIGVN